MGPSVPYMITVPSSADISLHFSNRVGRSGTLWLKTGSDVKSVTGLLLSTEEVVTPSGRMSCLCFLCVCMCVLHVCVPVGGFIRVSFCVFVTQGSNSDLQENKASLLQLLWLPPHSVSCDFISFAISLSATVCRKTRT